MSLVDFCITNYPAYIGGVDSPILIRDDGFGQYVARWPSVMGPQPTPEEVAAWTPPPPDPLPTVAAQYAGAKSYASDRLNTLMAAVALQIMGQGASESDTNAAGSAFVVQHASLIQAWLLTGANHVAGQALLAAILAAPPAWWSEPIAALFAEALLATGEFADAVAG